MEINYLGYKKTVLFPIYQQFNYWMILLLQGTPQKYQRFSKISFPTKHNVKKNHPI